MAISPLPQAPYRQDRKLFPTPVVGDVLFSQVKDCTRIEIPEYGTPHPDTKKWPDHKLVFVKPVDIERDGIFEFFYAADRDNQDLYNFTYSQGDLVLTRTYIISRDGLSDFVAPSIGTSDTKFGEYKFATARVQRVEDKELDSLYVAVQWVFSLKNTTIAADTETKTGYRINRITTIGNLPVTGGNTSSRFDEKGWTNQTEAVTFTGGTTSTTVEQRPFVRIQSDSTVSGTPSTPSIGTGTSRLVYDNGTTKVYENVVDTSTARPGPAGVEKEARPYANITTTKTYATSGNVASPTGSSQVVFNDGRTVVYEVNEITANAKIANVGEEKEERPYASLRTAKRYSTSGTVNTKTGSSNVVWTDGATTIYEVNDITATAKIANVGEEKEERPYVSLKTTKRYSTSGTVNTKTGSSNVVWTDGATTIYEVNDIAATAKSATAGEEKEERPYVSLTTTKKYSTSSAVNTKTGSSNVVWTDGTTTVYEVNTIAASPKAEKIGEEVDGQVYGTTKTDKSYETSPNIPVGSIGSTNIIWTDGKTKIYEKSLNSLQSINTQEFTSLYSKGDTVANERVITKYSEKPETGTSAAFYTSNLVYTDNKRKVYEIKETKIESENKEWDELVNYEWPSVLTSFWVTQIESKNTPGLYYYFPRMLFKQGFTGPQVAKVKQWWQKTAPKLSKPVIMVPSGTTFRSTFYDFTLPPCLHPKLTLGGVIGSKNPEYKVGVDRMVLPPTNYVDWPKEVSWTEVKPFKGGFLVNQTTLTPPDVKYAATTE